MSQSKEPSISSQEDWIPLLESTRLFGEWDGVTREKIAPKLTLSFLAKDDFLIRQGEPGDSLYILLEGQMEIFVNEEGGGQRYLDTLEPLQSVGELALLTGEKRNANVRAKSDSVLLSLTSHALIELKREDRAIWDKLSDALRKELEHAQIRHALFVSAYFAGFDKDALDDLQLYLKPLFLGSGQMLLSHGEQSDCAYIVISGRLRVTSNTEELVAYIGHGELVGEMSLLQGGTRSANVQAMRDTLVAVLSRSDFLLLLQKHPETMMFQFAATVVRRLQESNEGKREHSRRAKTLAIIPLHESLVHGDFTKSLAKSLSQLGSSIYLSSPLVEGYLGKEGASQTLRKDPYHPKLVQWLAEQETRHEFTLYEADPTLTPWTLQCLRHADHILFLHLAEHSPELTPLESALNDTFGSDVDPSKSLLLLHQPNTSPRGTRQWLEQRDGVTDHHHLRIGNQEDVARVARILTGNAVAVVLSGGGARGLAHIGAIRALRECQIPIDLIAGVSMGAVIAAQCASLWDFEDSIKRNQGVFNKKPDYTLPVLSLLVGQRWSNAMQALFGDIDIEDLWLNYFCISSNLSQCKMAITNRGSLWQNLRASTAVPGLLPPVLIDDEVYVDGGVFNNLPVDIMHQRNPGATIFAIDLSTPVGELKSKDLDEMLGGWQILGRQWNPFANNPQVPGLAQVLLGSSFTTQVQSEDNSRTLADLCWRLPVEEFGLIEFTEKAVVGLSQNGYQETLDLLTKKYNENDPLLQKWMKLPSP